jgi:hypothetical protein
MSCDEFKGQIDTNFWGVVNLTGRFFRTCVNRAAVISFKLAHSCPRSILKKN